MLSSAYWRISWDGQPDVFRLWASGTNGATVADRKCRRFCGPGPRIVLLSQLNDRLLVWTRPLHGDHVLKVELAAYVNKSCYADTPLLADGMTWAWSRWGPLPLIAYITPADRWRSLALPALLQVGWQVQGYDRFDRLVLIHPGDPT